MSSLTRHSKLLPFFLIALLCGQLIAPAQDVSGGANLSSDIRGGARLLNRRAANPPVHGRQKIRAGSIQTIPQKSELQAPIDSPKGDMRDEVEDALSLGNSARDSKPPRYQDAEKAYRLASKLNHKDPRPYIGLGNIFQDQKKFEAAADQYKKALKYAAPIYMSGSQLVATQVIRNRPNDPLSWEEKAQLWSSAGITALQRGRLTQAQISFGQAIQADAKNPEWHALLGYAFLVEKKFREAEVSFKSALERDPTNEDFKSLLARAKGKKD